MAEKDMRGFYTDSADTRAVPRLADDIVIRSAKVVQKDNDPVNSPSHYTSGGIETIDFIEAKQLNYNLGNVIKYVTRAGKKFIQNQGLDSKQQVQRNEIQDLEKAVWYLQREIKNLKG